MYVCLFLQGMLILQSLLVFNLQSLKCVPEILSPSESCRLGRRRSGSSEWNFLGKNHIPSACAGFGEGKKIKEMFFLETLTSS